MIIREAIRAFHDAIAMPVMAPIVVARPTTSDAVERYEARTSARLTGFERNVANFVAASDELARRLRAAAQELGSGSEASELTDFIDHLERMAERMAIDDARTEKYMLREARRQEKGDAGLAAAHRKAAVRLAVLNAQVIEALLALALEVRALRSLVAKREAMPVFEEPAALARFLDEALRA